MRELSDLYNTLANYGDDSELEITRFAEDELVLLLTLDVANGEKYSITLSHVGHIDIAPHICLGSVVFGSLELLPDNYLDTRWDCWQSESNLRVAKITSDDHLHYFVIYNGEETVEPQIE